MTPFPSSLSFASCLQYSPYGKSETSARSRQVTYAIKRDGFVGNIQIIPFAAQRLRASFAAFPFLADYFGKEVTLIPMPRSSLLKPGALWPPERICKSFQEQGLCGDILTCLERVKPVNKAALAQSRSRPTPKENYASSRVHAPLLPIPERVTIVDDVVTRGSSFVGVAPHLAAAFPGATIRYFALVRTISPGDVSEVLAPVQGIITFHNGVLHRDP